jgi:hypothetical protein
MEMLRSDVGLGDNNYMTFFYGFLGFLFFALGVGIVAAVSVGVSTGVESPWICAGMALPVLVLFWLSLIFFRHGDQIIRNQQED